MASVKLPDAVHNDVERLLLPLLEIPQKRTELITAALGSSSPLYDKADLQGDAPLVLRRFLTDLTPIDVYPGRNAFFEILRLAHHVASSEEPLYDELKRLPNQPEIVAAFPPNDTREMTSAALVFLSHNTADDASVEKLTAALKRHNLNVWHDGAELKGGNWWRKDIFEALKAMDRLIIVLSPKSIVSEGVLREVNSARAQGKRIVPVSFLPFNVLQPVLDKQPDMREITEQQIIFLHDGSGGGVEAAIQRVADEPDHVLIQRLTEFDENPYVGLNSFGENQSHLFFGRELEVDSLEQRFADGARVIAIQGPSGSGKSSLVSAGLIPRLRSSELVDTSRWLFLTIHPGKSPFESFADAIRNLDIDNAEPLAQEVLKRLTNRETWSDASDFHNVITWVLGEIAHPSLSYQEILLTIDQFEELFNLTDTPTREAFISGLIKAVNSSANNFRLITTLRADALVQLEKRPDSLMKILHEHQFFLERMDKEQLARAIRKPAEIVRIGIEPDLVGRLANDVDQSARLPLLQFALTRLYEMKDTYNNTLTMDAYRRMGGLAGGLAQLAEGAYAALSEFEQGLIRRMLLQMVTIAEDGSVSADPARRWVPMAELRYDDDTDGSAQRLLRSWSEARSRLLEIDRSALTSEPQVTICHEILARSWKQYENWIAESREILAKVRKLDNEATAWEQKSVVALPPTSNPITHALARWRKQQVVESYRLIDNRLADAEATMRAADTLITQAEQQRIAHYIAFSRQAQRRIRNRQRAFLATAALLVVALIFVWLRLTSTTLSDQANALANIALVTYPSDYGSLLAVEAYQILDTSQTRKTLIEVLQKSPYLEQYLLNEPDQKVRQIASDNNGRIAIVMEQRDIQVFDINRGRPVGLPIQFGDGAIIIWDAQFLDPQTIVAAGNDGTVRLLNANTGQQRAILHQGAQSNPIYRLAVDPISGRVAFAGLTGDLYFYDAATQTQLTVIKAHPNRVQALTYSPDGQWLASGDDAGLILLWQVQDGLPVGNTPYQTFTGHRGTMYDFAFSNGDRWLASASADNNIGLWDLQNGQLNHMILNPHHDERVRRVRFDSSGRLISSGGDGRVLFWHIGANGDAVALNENAPVVHTEEASGLVVIGDETESAVISAGEDGRIIRWSTIDAHAYAENLRTDPDVASSIQAVQFSPQGNLVYSGDSEANLWVFDRTTDPSQIAPIEMLGEVLALSLNPAQNLLAIAQNAGGTGIVDLWNPQSDEFRTPITSDGLIRAIAFSPDGTKLFTGDNLGWVSVWDTTDAHLISHSKAHLEQSGVASEVEAVAVRADGLQYATGSDEIIFWNAADDHLQHTTPVDHPITHIAYRPDGSTLISGHNDGSIRIWDTASGQVTAELDTGHKRVTAIAYSPDGQWFASGDSDGLILLWDAASREVFARFDDPQNGGVWNLTFSSDSHFLAAARDGWTTQTGTQAGGVTIYPVSPAEWIKDACALSARPLTVAEWNQFLPGREYDPTCQGTAPSHKTKRRPIRLVSGGAFYVNGSLTGNP